MDAFKKSETPFFYISEREVSEQEIIAFAHKILARRFRRARR